MIPHPTLGGSGDFFPFIEEVSDDWILETEFATVLLRALDRFDSETVEGPLKDPMDLPIRALYTPREYRTAGIGQGIGEVFIMKNDSPSGHAPVGGKISKQRRFFLKITVGNAGLFPGIEAENRVRKFFFEKLGVKL